VVGAGAPAVVVRPKGMIARPLVGIVLALALWAAPSLRNNRPLFIWNASPSVPIGLYWVCWGSSTFGELAVVRLPSAIASFAAGRGYLPQSAYLLKPVVAVGGDHVCRFGGRIFVRRIFKALARATDSRGQSLPTWHGCRTLSAGDVFLLAREPTSFDGRYFGRIASEHIVGRATLLWPRRAAR
jgi:conjugative transfer signal peptidase TraF